MSIMNLISNMLWPATVLTIIYLYSDEIRKLLSSFSKRGEINFPGINLKIGSSDDIPNAQLGHTNEYKKYLKTYENPIVRSEEEIIEKQLKDANISSKEAIDILIYHLASSQVYNRMLFLDKVIFPEQIKMLAYINEQNKPCSKLELSKFYDEWKKGNKENEYTYEEFLNYLHQQQLILKTEDDYDITIYGKEYLQFVIRIGRKLTL